MSYPPSQYKTYVTGETLTAGDLNNSFAVIASSNIPEDIDDYSVNASEMGTTEDPYPAASPSLATSASGELTRLRYQHLQLHKRFGPGQSQTLWYADFPYLFGVKGTDIASASSITIPSDGNYFVVTGTTPITSIAAQGVGSRVTLAFSGAVTVTHHATDLILPASENIITEAGDVLDFVEYASGDWRLVGMSRVPKVTAWTSYTPTGGWNTNVTYTGKWRRVGDTMEIRFKIACSGAPNNATPTISLPSSYTIDTAKLVEATDEQTVLGDGLAVDTGTAQYPLKVLYGSSTSAVKLKTIDVTGSDTLLGTMNSNAIPFSFGNGDSIHGTLSVPITGWTA